MLDDRGESIVINALHLISIFFVQFCSCFKKFMNISLGVQLSFYFFHVINGHVRLR